MRTVKILLALAAVAVFTTGALAQDAQKKKGSRVQLNPISQVMLRLEKVHNALENMDLTEEQKTKLSEIQKEVGPQMKDAMGKIGEVIGEEKMKVARETATKAREDGKSSRQAAVAVEAALKLDDAQNEKLTEIGKELTKVQRGMMKKVNGMLTPEQKKKLATAMTPGKKAGKGKQKQDK